MLFHIRLVDHPASRRTSAICDAWSPYLEAHAGQLLVQGWTSDDEGAAARSSLYFGEFTDRSAAQRFIDEEPSYRAGYYAGAEMFGWGNPLKRRWSDFAPEPGQVYWYLRGYAKPGAHHARDALFEAHKAYFAPWDSEHFIVRGGVTNEAAEWVGSANLIALPDRRAVEAFAAAEPFCKNGLFERMVIERFNPGGQGQARGRHPI